MTPPILTALAPDGRQLPVIDVTHPAFLLHHDEAEVRRRLDAFVREDDQLARLPDFLRKPLIRFLLRGSVFARALGAADGTYLGAVDTYTLKLGPRNLGPWAKRELASSVFWSWLVIGGMYSLMFVAFREPTAQTRRQLDEQISAA